MFMGFMGFPAKNKNVEKEFSISHAVDLDHLRALIAEQASDQPAAPRRTTTTPNLPSRRPRPCRPAPAAADACAIFGRGHTPHTADGLPLWFDTS
ncbi:hypothetical protein [Mycobacterium sp. KBS0706]|uniref:hypothetical protein n=1 Tax=Mycobacterium sp. KBS0706 TaxID=2578109 RepID=UPI0011812FAF|nr:hypothetical protein [Mycobacterium sp. KBS0706]